MTAQIDFFYKNYLDLDYQNPAITITDNVALNNGQENVDLMRNRENNSGWLTTQSDDSANTQIFVDLGDIEEINTILLVKHNFKDYLIEYFDTNSSTFVTYENVLLNENDTTTHTLQSSIFTRQIRLTINSTIIADADKELRQFIITRRYGTLEGWPQITSPLTSLNKTANKMLGGRLNILERRGFFKCSLNVTFYKIDQDLKLFEDIHYEREGILIRLSGGDEQQFSTRRVGYRNEDVFLVRPTSELSLPYVQGVYTNGIKLKVDLQEVVF